MWLSLFPSHPLSSQRQQVQFANSLFEKVEGPTPDFILLPTAGTEVGMPTPTSVVDTLPPSTCSPQFLISRNNGSPRTLGRHDCASSSRIEVLLLTLVRSQLSSIK